MIYIQLILNFLGAVQIDHFQKLYLVFSICFISPITSNVYTFQFEFEAHTSKTTSQHDFSYLWVLYTLRFSVQYFISSNFGDYLMQEILHAAGQLDELNYQVN